MIIIIWENHQSGERIVTDGVRYRYDWFDNTDSGYPGLPKGWQPGEWKTKEELFYLMKVHLETCERGNEINAS